MLLDLTGYEPYKGKDEVKCGKSSTNDRTLDDNVHINIPVCFTSNHIHHHVNSISSKLILQVRVCACLLAVQ